VWSTSKEFLLHMFSWWTLASIMLHLCFRSKNSRFPQSQIGYNLDHTHLSGLLVIFIWCSMWRATRIRCHCYISSINFINHCHWYTSDLSWVSMDSSYYLWPNSSCNIMPCRIMFNNLQILNNVRKKSVNTH